MLASTPNQGNRHIKELHFKCIGPTPYAGVAGMLLHINGKFTMGKVKLSHLSLKRFVLNRP